MPLNSNKKSSRKAKIIPRISIPPGNRPLLDLLEIQRKSFFDFLEHGIPHELAKIDIFRETTKNSIGTQELELILNPKTYTFISPNSTPKHAILKGKTYACKLYVQATLLIKSHNQETFPKQDPVPSNKVQGQNQEKKITSKKKCSNLVTYPLATRFSHPIHAIGISPKEREAEEPYKRTPNKQRYIEKSKAYCEYVSFGDMLRNQQDTFALWYKKDSNAGYVLNSQQMLKHGLSPLHSLHTRRVSKPLRASYLRVPEGSGSRAEDALHTLLQRGLQSLSSEGGKLQVAKLIPNAYAKWIKRGFNQIVDLDRDRDTYSVTEKLQAPSIAQKNVFVNKSNTIKELETLINFRLTRFTRKLEINKTGHPTFAFGRIDFSEGIFCIPNPEGVVASPIPTASLAPRFVAKGRAKQWVHFSGGEAQLRNREMQQKFFYQVLRKEEKRRNYSWLACFASIAKVGCPSGLLTRRVCRQNTHAFYPFSPLWRWNNFLFRKAVYFGILNTLKQKNKEKLFFVEVTPQTLFTSYSKYFIIHLSLSNTRCYLRLVSNLGKLPQLPNLNMSPTLKTVSTRYTKAAVHYVPPVSQKKVMLEGYAKDILRTLLGISGAEGSVSPMPGYSAKMNSLFPASQLRSTRVDSISKSYGNWNSLIKYGSPASRSFGDTKSIPPRFLTCPSSTTKMLHTFAYPKGMQIYPKGKQSEGKMPLDMRSRKAEQQRRRNTNERKPFVLLNAVPKLDGDRFNKLDTSLVKNNNFQCFHPWIYLGELPLMTKRGHFILNGSPRVIVNQIARCPGIYFQEKRRGVGFEQEVRVSADLIPQRGPWLRIQSDWEGRFWARLKQEGRVKYATLYEAFQEFEKQYNAPLISLVANRSSTFPKSEIIAFQERKTKEDRQKKALTRLFKNSTRYSLGELGRIRINQRIHFRPLYEFSRLEQNLSLSNLSTLLLFSLKKLVIMNKANSFIKTNELEKHSSENTIHHYINSFVNPYQFKICKANFGTFQETKQFQSLASFTQYYHDRLYPHLLRFHTLRASHTRRVTLHTLLRKPGSKPLWGKNAELATSAYFRHPYSEGIQEAKQPPLRSGQQAPSRIIPSDCLPERYASLPAYPSGKQAPTKMNPLLRSPHALLRGERSSGYQGKDAAGMQAGYKRDKNVKEYTDKKYSMLSNSLKTVKSFFQHSYLKGICEANTLLKEKRNYRSIITTKDFSKEKKKREQHLKNTSYFLRKTTGLSYIPYSYLSIANSLPSSQNQISRKYPLFPKMKASSFCKEYIPLTTLYVQELIKGNTEYWSRKREFLKQNASITAYTTFTKLFRGSLPPYFIRPPKELADLPLNPVPRRGERSRGVMGKSMQKGILPAVSYFRHTTYNMLANPSACLHTLRVSQPEGYAEQPKSLLQPLRGTVCRQATDVRRGLLPLLRLPLNPEGASEAVGSLPSAWKRSRVCRGGKSLLPKTYEGSNRYANSEWDPLGVREKKEKKELNFLLMAKDIDAIHICLERLLEGQGFTDDIDHLKNRFIRTSGKLLQQQFELGLHRLTEVITPLLKNLLQSHFLLLKDSPTQHQSKVALRTRSSELPIRMSYSCSDKNTFLGIRRGMQSNIPLRSYFVRPSKKVMAAKYPNSGSHPALPPSEVQEVLGSSILEEVRLPSAYYLRYGIERIRRSKEQQRSVGVDFSGGHYWASLPSASYLRIADPKGMQAGKPFGHFTYGILTPKGLATTHLLSKPLPRRGLGVQGLAMETKQRKQSREVCISEGSVSPLAVSPPSDALYPSASQALCFAPEGASEAVGLGSHRYKNQVVVKQKHWTSSFKRVLVQRAAEESETGPKGSSSRISKTQVKQRHTPIPSASQTRRVAPHFAKEYRGERSRGYQVQNTHLVTPFRWLRTSKPINGAFREFFGSNPLSQYMDQTNPLAEITHKRRLSSMGPGGIKRETAGMEVRGIHPTHYGRVCPIETPEGKNAGLVNSPTVYSRIGTYGFLETPLYQVRESQVQLKRWAFFSAQQEEDEISSLATCDTGLMRFNLLAHIPIPVQTANNPLAHFQQVERNRVGYRALSPVQTISIATALIPFLEHDDANRALMGSNMQRQAIPLLLPERPIVGTGFEPLVVVESGQALQATQLGWVSYINANSIVVHSLPPLHTSASLGTLRTEGKVRKESLSKAWVTTASYPLLRSGQQALRVRSKGGNPSLGNEITNFSQNVLRNNFDNEYSYAFLSKLPSLPFSYPEGVVLRSRNSRSSILVEKVQGLLLSHWACSTTPKGQAKQMNPSTKLFLRIPTEYPSILLPLGMQNGQQAPFTKMNSNGSNDHPTTPSGLPAYPSGQSARRVCRGIRNYPKGLLPIPSASLAPIPLRGNGYRGKDGYPFGVRYAEVKTECISPKEITKVTPTRLHLCSSYSAFFLTPVRQTLQPYQRSNQETCLHQRPLIQEGDWVQRGDFLADCSASHLGDLSLGKNVTVAYMPWEGYNFEDAIVISDRLVSDDIYTSLHIERYEIKVNKNSQGKERITNRIPGTSRSSKLLNNYGIARISSWVQPGDILVGKVVELKRPLSPYERLAWELASRLSPASPEREKWLNKVWLEDISLRLPPGICGRVINSQIISSEWSDKEQLAQPLEVHIYLAVKRKIQIGDKLAGRHGNKGIVSTILPQQDMPYLGDGRSIDMVLNPLGVPSRMNLGQIFECLLGLAGSQLGCNFKITPFDEVAGGEASRSLVFLKLYQCRLIYKQQWLFTPTFPGKSKLFDGRTGEPFENWITVGQAYMLKLIHMVDHKIHARSTGPYSLFTRQPVRGRSRRGGQRLGEMEVWAVEGFGAAYTLQEFLTIKSDDLKSRTALQRSFYKQNDITFGTIHISPGNPEAFKVLISELQALCLHIQM